MRPLTKVKKKTMLPCCIKSYTGDDEKNLRLLAKYANLTMQSFSEKLANNVPMDNWTARNIEEATLGVLTAIPIPDKMADGTPSSIPKIVATYRDWALRHEFCQCDKILERSKAAQQIVKAAKIR